MSIRDSGCESHLITLYSLIGVVTHSVCLILLTCYWSKLSLIVLLCSTLFVLEFFISLFLFYFVCLTLDQSRSHATLLRGLDLFGRVLGLLEPLFDLNNGRDGNAVKTDEDEAALDAVKVDENVFPEESEVDQVAVSESEICGSPPSD